MSDEELFKTFFSELETLVPPERCRFVESMLTAITGEECLIPYVPDPYRNDEDWFYNNIDTLKVLLRDKSKGTERLRLGLRLVRERCRSNRAEMKAACSESAFFRLQEHLRPSDRVHDAVKRVLNILGPQAKLSFRHLTEVQYQNSWECSIAVNGINLREARGESMQRALRVLLGDIQPELSLANDTLIKYLEFIPPYFSEKDIPTEEMETDAEKKEAS